MAQLLFGATSAPGTENPAISSVIISRPFFNPTLGQKVRISFFLSRPGFLSLTILDRDGFSVRTLVSRKSVPKGKHSYAWNGRDDRDEVVPDEAYSLKIDSQSKSAAVSYLPIREPARQVAAVTNYYDRRRGVFSYKLPHPARVHIQAGTVAVNPNTKRREGPVLKTLVNREPRPAGSVIETWNGLAEGGAFYVPDLPNFVTAVAATTLPTNSIITTGNRAVSFLERAPSRTGEPIFKPTAAHRNHHFGLTTLEDVAPELSTTPQMATWVPAKKLWLTAPGVFSVVISLRGPSATLFERQPARLYVYVDQRRAE